MVTANFAAHLVLASLLAASNVAAAASSDPAQYVDPFIGTSNGGHVFCGATRPFGVVKPVWDTSGGDSQGGYVSDRSAVYGISQTHDSGTGGSASLGNFMLLPQYCVYSDTNTRDDGCATRQYDRAVQRSYSKKSDAVATPGYFYQKLASGIQSETTVTDHVAVHRFDYSAAIAAGKANRGQTTKQGIILKGSGLDRLLGHVPVDEGGPPKRSLVSRRSSNLEGLAGVPRMHKHSHRDEGGEEDNIVSSKPPAPDSRVGASTTAAGPTLLLDLTNDLPHTYQSIGNLDMSLVKSKGAAGYVATITGGATFFPSFGKSTYKIYFCATVPGVKHAGTYTSGKFTDGGRTLTNPSNRTESGALLDISTQWLAANNNTLPVRIAVSFVSSKQACGYADSEAPNWRQLSSFNKIKAAARAKWNDVLGASLSTNLAGVSSSIVTNFYSSLYRTYIAPTNVTGDNPRFKSSEPAYDSLYCIWDSFRVVHPLYAILNPGVQAEVIRSVIDIWRFEGYMPDCRMSTDMGFVQGGSNSDSLLADSYVKGIRAGINWNDGLKAMIKNAEGIPVDWGVQGRGGVAARKALGYVPRDGGGDSPAGATVVPGRSASRTLEYAFNDASIAIVAAGLGNTSVYDDYLARSGDWSNLWNAALVSDNYTGFIQPRLTNGSFSFFDPRRCSPAYQFGLCYLVLSQKDAQFYEASGWQYSFYVPHDMHKLVGLMGGPDTFLDRLDHLWDARYGDIGDEVGFLPTYQYHYAPGGYSRTVDRVLKTLRNNFTPTTSGVPGNDDSGAMGAYYVWGTLGLFPVAGTSVYLLSTPLLPGWSVTSQLTGKTATLQTVNFDGASTNRYVVSATLDGEPYTRNWIDHTTLFLEGRTLRLTLGPQPGAFGAGADDVPPSVSTGGFSFDTAPLGY